MKRISLFTLGAMLGVGAITAGCSDDSNNTKPTAEEYDDTAQAIGSTTATSNGGSTSGGDMASMSDTVQLALGVTPPGITLAGDGHFETSKLGLAYSYSLTCTTAGNAAPCGPTSDTASADVKWSGNLNTDAVQASVTRDGSWNVSGLQTSQVTFNGDSSFTFDATLKSIFRPGVTTTYNFDTSAHYDTVVIDKGSRAAVSGSATFDVNAKHMVTGSNNNVDASFSVNAELTFNGNGTANLTLDGSQHYTVNLDTGAVVRVTAATTN